MKTLLHSISFIACFFLLSSNAISRDTETRNLDSFEGISVSAGIDAELVKGNTNKIEISASGIDLEKVTTEIKGGNLKVGINQSKWKFWGNKRKVSVTITYDGTLDYVSSSSGASVEADHTIVSNDLHLKTSSGAEMDLEIEANEVEIDLSSGSNMDLSGSAKSLEVDLSSGSTLDAAGLESEDVEVDGSSGASAIVYVTGFLDAIASSGASVKYKGNPSNPKIKKSSGGSVRSI